MNTAVRRKMCTLASCCNKEDELRIAHAASLCLYQALWVNTLSCRIRKDHLRMGKTCEARIDDRKETRALEMWGKGNIVPVKGSSYAEGDVPYMQ